MYKVSFQYFLENKKDEIMPLSHSQEKTKKNTLRKCTLIPFYITVPLATDPNWQWGFWEVKTPAVAPTLKVAVQLLLSQWQIEIKYPRLLGIGIRLSSSRGTCSRIRRMRENSVREKLDEEDGF